MAQQSYRMYVAGRWVEAAGGRTFPVTNPATGEVIGTVPDAGRADADAAVAAAHAAFPSWAGLPARERSRCLRRLYDLLVQQADRLARLLTSEQGKPLAEAKAEVLTGAEYLNWYAEEAPRIYGETIPASAADTRITVLRQPVGVAVAITPWNFPSSMITRKIAPALAAGCTVVVKPAEETPLSALALAELADQAGLPPGVVNVVTTADPAAVGDAFLQNRLVRKVSFTGSTQVGKYLMERAAAQMKRVSLELGGNAPFIVFDDADLAAAARHAAASKFRNNGQTCICANRIYVQEGAADRFTELFLAEVARLRVGSGLDPQVNVGPLINEAALQKVESHVADARARGAAVLAGGFRLRGEPFDSGCFYAPTVLGGVTDEMRVVQEETFGPVAPLLTFRTEAEVVARANATEFGLAAYVFTSSLGRATRMGERLEYGMVGINNSVLTVPQAPFGGVKESGIGREGGRHGLESYLEYKYIATTLID